MTTQRRMQTIALFLVAGTLSVLLHKVKVAIRACDFRSTSGRETTPSLQFNLFAITVHHPRHSESAPQMLGRSPFKGIQGSASGSQGRRSRRSTGCVGAPALLFAVAPFTCPSGRQPLAIVVSASRNCARPPASPILEFRLRIRQDG